MSKGILFLFLIFSLISCGSKSAEASVEIPLQMKTTPHIPDPLEGIWATVYDIAGVADPTPGTQITIDNQLRIKEFTAGTIGIRATSSVIEKVGNEYIFCIDIKGEDKLYFYRAKIEDDKIKRTRYYISENRTEEKVNIAYEEAKSSLDIFGSTGFLKRVII